MRVSDSMERLGVTIANAIAAAASSGKLAIVEDHENGGDMVAEEVDIAGAKPETVGVSLPSSPSLVPLESPMLTR